MSVLTSLRGYALVFPFSAIAGTLAVSPLLDRPVTAMMLAVETMAFIVLLANFLFSWAADRSARTDRTKSSR